MNNLISLVGNNSDCLLKGFFGLEKENIRVNKNGEISQKAHPSVFGDKETNPYITVDFAESQLEIITPTLPSIKEAYDFLQNLHEIVITNLDDEFLWPQSSPPILPEDISNISLAKFDKDVTKEQYRKQLAEKYGHKKQLLSGIHFNFSFDKELIQLLYKNYNKEDLSLQEFTNEIYLKVVRNYFRYGWLLVYLLGASPAIHESYGDCCNSEECDEECLTNLVSFRNSFCGYKNDRYFLVNHDSLEQYIHSIETLVSEGVLSSAREYYSPIRLKSNSSDIIKGLKEDGISYLELRSIDLNPLSDIGITLEDLQFIHLFLIYLLVIDCDGQTAEEYLNYINKAESIASCGRGDKVTLKQYSEIILDDMLTEFTKLSLLTEEYKQILELQHQKLECSYAEQISKQIKQKGFIEFHMERAKKSKQVLSQHLYTLKGYEDLELSTQILLRDAILRGIKFEILDRRDNFIKLIQNDNIQYVKQATKTSLDSYISVLIMENKVVTKKVLNEYGISAPKGKEYYSIEDALFDRSLYLDNIVIKPKSTNFGLGITIIKDQVTNDNYKKALEIAFTEDSTVLIEEFVQGKEYRFLVIGEEVVGVLHRVPANIVGDGVHTIQQLVTIKNQDPLRGSGYKTPLEKLQIGKSEELFLQMQNLNIDYVPENDQVIYLRENSNISTGGDSLDYTDFIHESYKQIAIQSVKHIGAKICGVDMMIQNIDEKSTIDNYSIIELNFNPAIHIHCYPYKGENRYIGRKVLDILGYQ